MKQILLPRPDIKITKRFNQSLKSSLKILEYSNDELLIYLNEQISNQPFVSLQSKEIDSDAYLEYDHSLPSLYDELSHQLLYSKRTIKRDIFDFLFPQLDSNGYFRCSYKEMMRDCPYSEIQIKDTLSTLRSFEPLGIFAFSLKQCLQIQCKYSNHPLHKIAFQLCEYLEELALHHFEKIVLETGYDLITIEAAYQFIQNLNPKPAANYSQSSIILNPEFKIEVQDSIQIHFINNVDLQFETESSDLSVTFLKEQKKKYQSLLNAIQKRELTLYAIMKYLCDIQSDFFINQGLLKHCTQQMVADACGYHVSTISRAISNKSFEFNGKYCALSSLLSSGGNQEYSNEHIKKRIKEIIKQEDPKNPYSDEKLRKLLDKENIIISRRAIAKYREACMIFNSTKRRR